MSRDYKDEGVMGPATKKPYAEVIFLKAQFYLSFLLFGISKNWLDIIPKNL